MQFAERCSLELTKVKNPFPRFDVPEGETIDSYFEQVCRAGWKKRRETAVAHLESRGILHKTIADYEARLEREIDDQADEVSRLLPDRVGLHPLREGSRHSGGAGARIGGG